MQTKADFTPRQLALMRKWVTSRVWTDLEPAQIRWLSPARIVEGITRYYEGGPAGFLADMMAPAPELAAAA